MGKIIDGLIVKYQNIENNSNYDPQDSNFDQGENAGSSRVAFEVIQDLKQLKSSLPTQQDKVVVPVVKQFIADFYESYKNDLTQGMYDLIVNSFGKTKKNRTEMEKLLIDTDVDLISLLNSMKDGYTVEKEQLYWIYDPIADQYLGYDRVEEKAWWLLKQNDGARAELTDAEITKVGEQYRAFAVPVEEDE